MDLTSPTLFTLFVQPQVSWIYGSDPALQQYRQALYRTAWDAVAFVEHVISRRSGGDEAYVSVGTKCGGGVLKWSVGMEVCLSGMNES